MVVRAVDTTAGERPLDPPHEGFVTNVHPQGDLGLPAIPAEVTFADQQADHQTLLEISWHSGCPPGSWLLLFHRKVPRETPEGRPG